MRRPAIADDPARAVDAILRHTGGDVVLGLPLGLGKAPAIANALYDRAAADRSIRLRIFTALTLEPPQPKSDLERRLMGPVIERVFDGYPAFRYAEALRGDGLPANIEVNEFFFLAPRWTGVAVAQRHYISANYSDASGYLRERGVNVIAQLVAPDGQGERYSLSCNPELTLELDDLFAARGGPCLLVGQTNAELPFMDGPAALPAGDFDHVLTGHDFPLYAPPYPPVSDADHAIGLRAAALVPDGGTVQIGIGSVGDAFNAALLMRHREPALFRETLERLGGPAPPEAHAGPFREGLFSATEMVVPSLLELLDAGILSRPASDGALVHGGFFLGPRDFYRRLREMDADARARISMKPIGWTNTLLGAESEKRADRQGARFVNNAMMVTLLGEAVSDTLEDGRVVSGVGGQYDFVAQAADLADARSVMTVNATRMDGAERKSTVVWSHGRMTVPRHLRDLVVTEYGVADLRGRSDGDCIAAMTTIADSAFQSKLLDEAGAKAPPGARPHGRNTPGRIRGALGPARAAGWLGRWPFGTDLTEAERRLVVALEWLEPRAADRATTARTVARAMAATLPRERALLDRLSLADPSGLNERIKARLVRLALRETAGEPV